MRPVEKKEPGDTVRYLEAVLNFSKKFFLA